jgi:photosystem II stability/assembly factor-like uncharacterized protein
MSKLIYLSFIAISFFLFSTKSNFKIKTNFHAESEGLNEHTKHKLQEQIMLADPITGKIPAHQRSLELAYYKQEFGYQKNIRSGEWTSLGPDKVGGRTRSAVLDITNERNIIAAGVSGGIWRSTDGGANWTRVSNPKLLMGAVSISQDKRTGKQNIWYALTGEASGNSASGGGSFYLGDGIFKSLDSGKTWDPLPSTATGIQSTFSTNFQVGWRVINHPSVDSDYVFAACYGIVYKSNNAGASWTTTLGAISNNSYYTDVVVAKNGTLYATLSSDGAIKGFFRSNNIGVSWTDITPMNLLKNYNRTVMGINPNNENEVYFFSILDDSTNLGGTKTSNYQGNAEYISLLKYNYLSGDGANSGGSWLDLSKNLPDDVNTTTGGFDKLNVQGGYNMLVKVQPNSNALIIGGTNLFISEDAFATKNKWRQIGGYKLGTGLPKFEVWDNHHPDNHEVLFYPSDSKKMMSINDGGLFVVNNVNLNPTTWISLNNGYITTQPYAVTLAPDAGNKWIHSGFQDNGNYVSNDWKMAKNGWTLPLNGDGAYGYIAPKNNFFLFSIQEGRIGKFLLDSKGTVINRRRIDPIGATRDDYVFINPFVVDPNDNNILYVPAGKKLFRQNQLSSLEVNGSWDSISTGYTLLTDTIKTTNISAAVAAQITCIAVSKKPANVVYFGTSKKEIYKIENAHTGNPSMTLISKTNMPTGFVSSIAIDPEDANKVLMCFSNYNIKSMYYTIDGGNTWDFCGGNLDKTTNFSMSGPSIRSVAIMKTPDGKRKYFVGTSIGLYSADSLLASKTVVADTTKWIQESVNGIGTSVVNNLYVRQSDYVVAASTHGNGVYISQYFQAPIIIPNEFAINIYPNPSPANINMEFSLPENTIAQIGLFDATGKLVRVYKNKFLEAGTQKLEINSEGIASGLYLLYYQDDKNRSFNRKIILAK